MKSSIVIKAIDGLKGWRRVVAIAIIAAAVIAYLSLAGCAIGERIVDRTQDVVEEYCETYTQDEREALRERINAGSTHKINVTCEGDTSSEA